MAERLNLDPSPEGLLRAVERCRAIQPIIERIPRRSRMHQVADAAKRSGAGTRSVYRRVRAWEQGGILALVPNRRADLGRPRIANHDAFRFVEQLVTAKRRLTVSQGYRAYCEERAWRMARARGTESDLVEIPKYGRVTKGNLASRSAQLPKITRATFRTWFRWLMARASFQKACEVSKKPFCLLQGAGK